MKPNIFRSPRIFKNCVLAGIQKALGHRRITIRHPQGVRLTAGNLKGQGQWCAISGIDYEPELPWLLENACPESVLVDVGANIGIFSLFFAAKARRPGSVFSLEPCADAYDLLCHNIRQNGLEEVIVPIPAALGKNSGKAVLQGNQTQWNALSIAPAEGSQGQHVDVISLPDLMRNYQLQRLDYLKIDAEGKEGEILEGGIDVIQAYRPTIILEVTFQNSQALARKTLEEIGYTIETLTPLSPNCIAVPG